MVKTSTIHRKQGLVIALIAATVVAAACRTPRRALRVGSDAASLQLSMTNLDPADQGKAAWIYELSGCVAPLNGILGEGDVVTFKAVSLKNGLKGCQFRVKIAQARTDIVFISDSEPNVLYWSKDFEITQDAQGALIATAGLQKLYTPKVSPDQARSMFTLEMPIKFPRPETDLPVTAALACTPAIANIGTFEGGAPEGGTFKLAVPVDTETDFTCSTILVSAGGILHKYRGDYLEGATFKATPDGTWKAPEITLTLQVSEPPAVAPPTTAPTTDIKVDAKEQKKCDPATQVFDTETRSCIDR